MLFLLFDVKKNRDTINLYSLIFFLLGLAFFIVQTIQITIFSSIGEKITRKVRIEVFSKILKLPISWF
jgi:ABC-type bacteriocin/lantibiotic exporter with double-glycine peptidase domain